MSFPSAIANPTVAGDTRFSRSIVATSSSMGLPGTTSVTSLTVHFLPLAYRPPHTFACSPRYFVSDRATTSRGSRDSVDVCQCARSSMWPIALPLDESVDAAGLSRIGPSHALLRIAKQKLYGSNRAATGRLEMYQQMNVNETPRFQGDAINELFGQHYKASLRTAYRILRSQEDSEDAVQTAYCAAYRSLHRFRGESSFKTWITRIVVNCCLMQLRERRARPQVALDDLLPALESHTATPETLCYVGELQAAHTTAASRLPQKLKDVYAPCLIAGMAFPTVAHHLGLSANAAKSRLFRARRKVEQALQSISQRRAA